MDKPLRVFCSYAPEDRSHLIQFQKHLRSLEHQGLITLWADTNLSPGAEKDQEINKQLNAASLILLLVSPDFIASDYCYNIETKRAMEQFKEGKAVVIPILLRPVEWQLAPFEKLQVLPRSGEPIIGLSGRCRDDVLFDVAKEIRKIVEEFLGIRQTELADPPAQTEQEIAEDNRRESDLQVYLDRMSELLLQYNLTTNDEARKIARVRTQTLLSRLDSTRKGRVLQFLYEAKLIDQPSPIINLYGVDLKSIKLQWVHLEGCDLSGANLEGADLEGTRLNNANLAEAHLNDVNLHAAKLNNANLERSDLSKANLEGAKLNNASLREAHLWDTNLSMAHLEGTNLSRAVMSGADLFGANLYHANLSSALLGKIGDGKRANLNCTILWDADLRAAYLFDTDMIWADLRGANLEGANLERVDLSRAILTNALVTKEQLEKASSLKYTTMPEQAPPKDAYKIDMDLGGVVFMTRQLARHLELQGVMCLVVKPDEIHILGEKPFLVKVTNEESLSTEDWAEIKEKSNTSDSFDEQMSTYYESGMVALEQGRWEKAELCFKEALEKESNDRPMLAAIYHNLGAVTMAQEKWDDAKKYFTGALQIRIEYEDKEQLALLYHNLGGIAQTQEKWEEARKNLTQALQIFEERDDRRAQAMTQHQIGIVACEQGNWEEAKETFLSVLPVLLGYREHGSVERTLRYLAKLWQRSQDATIPVRIASILRMKSGEIEGLLSNWAENS